MSADAVNRLCYDLSHDPALAARLRADPEGELAGRTALSPAEREELIAGDVAALYLRGVHPVLLVRLATFRVFGLYPARYAARIGTAGAGGAGQAGTARSVDPARSAEGRDQPGGRGTGVSHSSCASEAPRTVS